MYVWERELEAGEFVTITGGEAYLYKIYKQRGTTRVLIGHYDKIYVRASSKVIALIHEGSVMGQPITICQTPDMELYAYLS